MSKKQKPFELFPNFPLPLTTEHWALTREQSVDVSEGGGADIPVRGGAGAGGQSCQGPDQHRTEW